MKKITSLTAKQVALIPEWRDQWLAHGLKTGAADRKEAERGVDLAYKAAGLEPPKLKIWLDSPFAGAIGAAMLASKNFPLVGDQVRAQVGDRVRDQVRDRVRDQVRDQVRDRVWAQVEAQVRDRVWAQVEAQVGAQVGAQVWAQVGAQVWDQVWAQVWAQVGAQVWDQVRDQVGAQVEAQVRDQVRDRVWAQVEAQVRDQVRDQVGRAAYGLHDAGWLSFYDFFARVCALESVAKLEGLIVTSKSCGWWWPFTGAVILTERPRFLHRDERGRLHNETHKAIEYPDGWGFYVIHGVRVPADIIENPESITAARLKSETNAEVRRVMMQRFGFDRYISEIGAKKIHADSFGTLYRVEDEAPFHIAHVINATKEPDGTFKPYYLPLPDINDLTGKPIKTAHEGIAWTWGLHASEYRPEVQA